MNWLDCIPTWSNSNTISNDEIIAYVRAWRNAELAASDWTQLPDVDMANKWDWAVYRQELRDMMNKGVSAKEIAFPTPPV